MCVNLDLRLYPHRSSKGLMGELKEGWISRSEWLGKGQVGITLIGVCYYLYIDAQVVVSCFVFIKSGVGEYNRYFQHVVGWFLR